MPEATLLTLAAHMRKAYLGEQLEGPPKIGMDGSHVPIALGRVRHLGAAASGWCLGILSPRSQVDPPFSFGRLSRRDEDSASARVFQRVALAWHDAILRRTGR